MLKKKYVASVSFGKDSVAMLLMLIEKKWPLDEAVFYDTGMEFNAIYQVREQIRPVLQDHGIQYVELKPERPFLYDMLEKPVYSKQKGNHCGYGWCGGLCRWGTTNKLKALDAYAEQNGAVVYIGIAADEVKRLARLRGYKRAPLAEWGLTEADALRYCRKHGIHWTENGIDLYDILDRVSCWCCCNKNQKELFNIWKYLPEYWNRLKELQSKIRRPMKKFRTDQTYGDLGNIINLERYWKEENNAGKFERYD
ncbi:MAG: phosphoadenosine phosphosulfate reductase family protein [Treponema sp.]|nr:phosphoadenosine phosphosulfate reductase family protein [Treponema sp.]